MHWGTGYKGFYKKRFRIIGSKNEILVVFCGVNKTEITEQLIILMRQQPGMEDFTIAWSTVRNIHLENS